MLNLDLFAGCDPSSLQHHLSKLDSSIDSTFFTYILTLLSRHPAIQFVLSTYPIPDENGNVQLGSAPLPSDYVDPSFAGGNVDDEVVQPERIKGRQLAFHLAGEQYRTDKEAAQDKRAMQEKRRKEKRSAARRGLDFEDENIAGPRNSVIDQDGETMAKPEEESDGLLRVLGEDDGDEEAIRVMKTDLRGLMEKWGSRLRIRCTDDDIYFRLVGTHHKVNVVFTEAKQP